MATIQRTQNKLLKSGYLPSYQTDMHETWIDVKHNGTPITFYKCNDNVDQSFRVHGATPDRPEYDEYTSHYSKSLTTAIRISRLQVTGLGY